MRRSEQGRKGPVTEICFDLFLRVSLEAGNGEKKAVEIFSTVIMCHDMQFLGLTFDPAKLRCNGRKL